MRECSNCGGAGKVLGEIVSGQPDRYLDCGMCSGRGTVGSPDPGTPRTVGNTEPTWFTNVLVTLVFGFFALIATVVVVTMVGGWLGRTAGFHAFTEGWVPDAWLADTGQEGDPIAPALVFGLVLVAAFAITVARRRASRAWLADRRAPRSQLVRTVLSFGLLRSAVLVFGAAAAFGTGVVVGALPDQRADLLAGPSGALSGFQWGIVVLAIVLWTLFTMGRSLGKYDRLADAQPPVPEEAPGPSTPSHGWPAMPPPPPPATPSRDSSYPPPPPSGPPR